MAAVALVVAIVALAASVGCWLALVDHGYRLGRRAPAPRTPPPGGLGDPGGEG